MKTSNEVLFEGEKRLILDDSVLDSCVEMGLWASRKNCILFLIF